MLQSHLHAILVMSFSQFNYYYIIYMCMHVYVCEKNAYGLSWWFRW